MKYLHGFDSFKEDKKVNEGFLGSLFGGLFNSLKNKLSLSLSKEFGNAGKADKILEEYKNEAIASASKKFQMLKVLAEYKKAAVESGETDEGKITKMKTDIETSNDQFKQSMKILKQKYDLKLKDVIEEEENPKIKNYIQIKKLEMKQEILAKEMQILQEVGIDEKLMANDKDFQEIIKKVQKQTSDANNLIEKNKELLESTKDLVRSFDMEAAKKAAQSEGEQYVWKDSPFIRGDKGFKLKRNDIITYFSKDNFKKEGDSYEGTKAKVLEVDGGRVSVKTVDSGSTIDILMGKVIKKEQIKKEEKDKVPDESSDDGQAKITV